MASSHPAHKTQGLGDVRNVTPIILDGKKLDARIDQAITASSLERTIDGASTLSLTVTDPERFLLAGGYYERQADLLLDDLWFRMITMDKSGDDYTVTFEDREVALLRRHKKHRVVSRSKMTRAEFAASLVHEVAHIHFVARELHKTQKIAPHSKADKKTLTDTKTRGIARNAKVTVKGRQATPAQIALMQRVLDVAQSLGAGKQATLAMIVANIGEAEYSKTATNPKSGAKGLFQLLPSTASNFGLDPMNIEATAHQFLVNGYTADKNGNAGAIPIAKAHPDWSPGTIASKVEGSDQGGGFYDAYLAEAKKIYDAYGGVTSGPPSDGQDTYVTQYTYSRGKPGGPDGEDTWTCIQRLATQVHWRCFIVAGVVYFISDYDLIRSQPRMTITEKTPGIDSIDFSLDTSAKVPDEMTIAARAARWAAPPGTVVVVNQDFGAAAGAWIVSDILRPDLYEDATTITLTRPQAPLLEPASSVSTRSSSGKSTMDGGVNAGPTSTGDVSVAPGANRPGVPLKQHVLDFLGLVAGLTSEKIEVTTGTNHNQFVLGTQNQSDHWTGDAADIGVGGDARTDKAAGSKGDNIATAALRVLGINENVARQWAQSGALDFGVASTHTWKHDGKSYRVQVGWRTLVGGNHYNHVHIGVKG